MPGRFELRSGTIIGVVLAVLAVAVPSSSPPGPRRAEAAVSFPAKWIHGSANCAENTDPPFQVHRLDDETYILRQNKCSSFEAPFLYLLFGQRKALLLDSGAPGQPFPLRETVRRLIADHLAARGRAEGLDLIVVHSHRHGDHTFGDEQLRAEPRTTVVPHASLSRMQQFFGLTDWPNGTTTFDLGGRPLTIIPIPGHEVDHIAIYDTSRKILLTGDTLYPGHLFIRDWDAYRKSVRRLAAFALRHGVSHVLGAHVEMTRHPRVPYDYGTTFQPEEHVLQLGLSHLLELRDACDAIGETPRREVRASFVIEPRGF